MFETIFPTDGSVRRRVRKGATLFLSMVVHAVAVAAIIVVPLLRAEAVLPDYRVIYAGLMSPPILPGIPPAGNSHGRGGKERSPVAESAKPRPRHTKDFTVPTEIIKATDEDLTSLFSTGGSGPGVDGGINLEEGENREWDIGEEIIPESFDPEKGTILNVTPPRLVKMVNPVYPPAAIAARVSGIVIVAAVTDIYGRVSEVRVISGHPLLNAAALKAVRDWLYEPHLINGIPKAVRFTVTVTFTLEKN